MIDDVEATIKDVELFKAAGGQAVYDATAFDYGRDPVALRTIAERTGIRIIATAGFNKAILSPAPMPGTDVTFRAGSPPKAAPSCATMSWRSSPRGWTAPTSGAAWPSSARLQHHRRG